MARSDDFLAPDAIGSFTNDLFELRKDDNGRESYGVQLHFGKATSLAVLEQHALQAAEREWPGKAAEWIKNGLIKSPFLDGDGKQGFDKEGTKKPGHAGTTFIRCKSGKDFKPKVYDRQMIPVGDKAAVPSGSVLKPVLNCFTWDHPTNGKGLTFGVVMVQVVKKAEGDEVLGGGGGSPEPGKFFEKIADEGAAPDSTKTGAGASGLFG